jgi:transposase
VIPAGARVWPAMCHTDMRKGMQGLALLVQQALERNPHGGDLSSSAAAPDRW